MRRILYVLLMTFHQLGQSISRFWMKQNFLEYTVLRIVGYVILFCFYLRYWLRQMVHITRAAKEYKGTKTQGISGPHRSTKDQVAWLHLLSWCGFIRTIWNFS